MDSRQCPEEVEAIDLLQRTKVLLAESNLRLHKIASNSAKVMEAFPEEERDLWSQVDQGKA